VVRYSILGVNALLLFGILTFVLLGQHSGSASPKTVLSATTTTDKLANPLDQVSSADIAVNIARMSGLQEGAKIAENADSVDIELALPPASTSIVAKPQVVATSLKSKKDIQTYVAVPGDTVTNLATKFGITSDSIRWSNGLESNTLNAGQKLVIPPSQGIVYTVKAGDTPDTLASKYKASKEEIIATNDAEITPIKIGDRILIPNGTQPSPVVNTRVVNAGFGWGGATYGNNTYTFGYCTWYVANKIQVPNNWGNANTWDNRAAMSGWVVSSIPRAGSIGQTDRGSEGHVAYVEAVSDDGTMIKYSDMNGLAGWGRAGYSEWTSAAKFEHYIYQ
jgi:surface antigen